MDNSGNVKYINSQGIIVYNSVEGATGELTYTRTTNSDVTIITNLDENNKIEEIRQGNTILKDEDYTVSRNEVKLKGSYLENLPAGSYSFIVSYKPFGEDFYEGDFPKDVTVNVKVIRSGLSEDNFNFAPPEDPTYNGEAKEATVTASSDEIGKINIKYYDISDPDASERELSGAPINPGTYKVKISVDQSDKYDSAEIIDGGWTFKVEYLEPGNNPYEITISEEDYKQDDSNYWLKDNNMATISPTEKDYKISTKLNEGYTSELKVSSWTPGTAIYLQDDKGHMTDAIKVNVNISQDKNSPTGSITIKDRTPWESLINVITFGLFFKEEQIATITASDGESGIQEAKYLVSNSDLIQKENATLEEISTVLDGQTGWATFAGSSKDVVLEKDNKYVVYEKITDNVGHVTYISSDGIVVYSDSTTDTSTVSYPKTTKKDIEVKITTNGNTIKDIKIDDSEIDKENYEISAEDEYKKRTITFKGVYLDTLSDGTHILTISYNPQGESYAEGDEPEETQIELFVQTLNIDTDGDGKADINIDTNEDGEADFNVDIDGDGEPDINVDKSTWGEKVENSGVTNYVDEKGMTSTEITNFGMIWLREESDGTSAWYGLDNSDGTFKLGSRFWVRWLSKEKDQEEWEYYYDNLDENHKNLVDSGRLWIFLAGVTASNGQEYKEFNKEVKFYIQLGEDWEKDDINAVFISQESDEVVDVEYAENTEYPEGSGEFAKLTLKHFSPYAVYDYLENQEEIIDSDPDESKVDDTTTKNQKQLRRTSQILKRMAKERTNNRCELETLNSCRYFTSIENGKNYLEIHHLVPFEFSNDFNSSLEIIENYVALCPHCHRLLHFGVDRERKSVITYLYNQRCEGLKNKGIDISLKELLAYYDFDE